MSIKTYAHHLPEKLFERFSEAYILCQHQGVFAPTYVMVQSTGIKEWLKLQIADVHGIFGQVHFITPNYLPFLVCRALGKKYQSALNSEGLLWKIHAVLGQNSFTDAFPKVSSYYAESDVKRMQLAIKLSDLFDQYQLYRMDMIEAWNTDNFLYKTAESIDLERWQKAIWTSIQPKNNVSDSDVLDNRGILEYLKAHPDEAQAVKTLFPCLFAYALSGLSPYHSQLLSYIAQICDVRLYLLNPSPTEYWYDIKSNKERWYKADFNQISLEDLHGEGHPFLIAQSRLLRNLVLQLAQADVDFFNHFEADSQLNPTRCLHEVQAAMIENKAVDDSRAHRIHAKAQDQSIYIGAHYNPYREVQGLYHYLLRCLEQDPNIRAEEIAVLCPKLDSYAPYIDAVFNQSQRPLPFYLALASDQDPQSPVRFVFAFLQLNAQEFTTEKALELMDFPALRKQYGIQDLIAIREALQQVNAVGLNYSEANESELHQLNWDKALMRLASGAICESGINVLKNGADYDYLVPIAVDNPGNYAAILRFVAFVDDVNRFIQVINTRKEPQAWGAWLAELIDCFLPQNTQDERDEIQELLSLIQGVNEQEHQEVISIQAYTAALKLLYRESENDRPIFRGKIICAHPKHLRAIPFKVVAYLGLNTHDFPKINERSSFNIMQLHPRFGDRNLKDNDRHLFIESMISARDNFYMSYLGKNEKTDKNLPPSVLIDELLESLHLDDEQVLRVQHPLYQNSKRYGSSPLLFAYQADKNVAHKTKSVEKENIDKSSSEMLDDFIAYFKNAPSWYFRNVAKLSFYSSDQKALSSIKIDSSYLEQSQIYNAVSEAILQHQPVNILAQKLKSTGELPIGPFAETELMVYHDEIQDALRQASAGKIYKAENLRVHSLTKSKLSGSIQYFEYDNTYFLIDIKKSSKGHKYLLALFLNAALLARELNTPVNCLYLSSKDVIDVMVNENGEHQAALDDFLEAFDQRYEALTYHHADSILQLLGKDGTVKEKKFKDLIIDDEKYPLIKTDEYFKYLYDAGLFYIQDEDEETETVSEQSEIGLAWLEAYQTLFSKIPLKIKNI